MTCKDFLTIFSEYRDGVLDPRERRRADRHLDGCPSCRRYRRVVDDGVEALRARRPLPVSADFRPRLRHRLYHVEDGDVLGPGSPDSRGSGVSGLAAAGMALLLTIVAWSPVVRPPEVEVTLSPVVVHDPARPVPGLSVPAAALFQPSEPLLSSGTRAGFRERPAILLPERPPSPQLATQLDREGRGAERDPGGAQRP